MYCARVRVRVYRVDWQKLGLMKGLKHLLGLCLRVCMCVHLCVHLCVLVCVCASVHGPFRGGARPRTSFTCVLVVIISRLISLVRVKARLLRYILGELVSNNRNKMSVRVCCGGYQLLCNNLRNRRR